jgi:hypothetical protein
MLRKAAHGLFQVFAFRDSTAGAMLHTAAEDTRHDFCLVDGTRPYYGKAARLEADGTGTLRWVSDEDLTSPDTLYYSNDNLRVPYAFRPIILTTSSHGRKYHRQATRFTTTLPSTAPRTFC